MKVPSVNRSADVALATVLGTAVLFSVSACGAGGTTSGSAFSERDSSGIRITVSGAPVWQDGNGWEIGPEPRLRIGMADGPEDQILYGVGRVAWTDGGEIFISQRTDIRFYAESGELVRRLGGQGAGPGEFLYIGSAIPCGDRVLAIDLMRPGITIFVPNSSPYTIPGPPPGSGGLVELSLLRCSSGTVLGLDLSSSDGAEDRDRINRAEMRVVRLPDAEPRSEPQTGSSDAAMETILAVPGLEVYRGLTVPFGRHTYLAVGNSEIYTADSGEPEIRVYDLDGSLRRIIRLNLPEVRVTSSDIQRIRSQYLDGKPAGIVAELEPLLDAVPIAPTMPYFSSLKVGDDGTLWLRANQSFRDEPARRWYVVSADGRWLGEVVLPERFTPHEFRADEVLGVWRDENDVEQVRSYPIVKG